MLQENYNPVLLTHLFLSLAAYGLFTLAAILALLDAFQEHAIKTKHLGKLFHLLPPIELLEQTLFRLVLFGFILLTLSILSGILFHYQETGRYFLWTHKILFTWATWSVFAVLLLGRHFQGWRGGRAVRWTLSGYALLVLAYLGVKFVRAFFLR